VEFPTVLQPNSSDSSLLLGEANHGCIHFEVKAGICSRLLSQEIEELPLRHHRNERRRCPKMRQVADRPIATGKPKLGGLNLVVRALEEALEHPELVEDLHRRWVHCVPAEIAEEVGVLLEYANAAAGASAQQPRHHPGGTTAYDH
jgi:hypothetical protein